MLEIKWYETPTITTVQCVSALDAAINIQAARRLVDSDEIVAVYNGKDINPVIVLVVGCLEAVGFNA